MSSSSNAYIETFNDSKIHSLCREVCQNSIDAKINDDSYGRVEFKLFDMDSNLVLGRDEWLKHHLFLVEKTWANDDKGAKFLRKMR